MPCWFERECSHFSMAKPPRVLGWMGLSTGNWLCLRLLVLFLPFPHYLTGEAKVGNRCEIWRPMPPWKVMFRNGVLEDQLWRRSSRFEDRSFHRGCEDSQGSFSMRPRNTGGVQYTNSSMFNTRYSRPDDESSRSLVSGVSLFLVAPSGTGSRRESAMR